MTGVTITGVLTYVVLTPAPGKVSIASTGPQGPPGPAGGGTYTWNGSAYALDTNARVFVQRVGDPDPTGLSDHDFVYQEF